MEIAGLQKTDQRKRFTSSLFPNNCNAHLDITLMVFGLLPKVKLWCSEQLCPLIYVILCPAQHSEQEKLKTNPARVEDGE